MNSGFQKSIGNIFSSVVQTQYVPVRYRYYAEKIARGPVVKKFGYVDRISQKGVLPRLKDAPKLPMPTYKPVSAWTHDKVMQGRNDYIDILGGGKLKPHDVSYEVPKWLRGRKGREMQLLILKQKVFKHTLYQAENPTMWNNMHLRIKYLYNYLNRKTKTYLSKQ